jgi:hypothetical protein
MQRDDRDDPRYSFPTRDAREELAILYDRLHMTRPDLSTMIHSVLLLLSRFGSMGGRGGRGRGGGIIDLTLGGVLEG